MVSADETFTESALDAALSWLLGSLVKNFPALNFIDKKSTTKLYGQSFEPLHMLHLSILDRKLEVS